MYYQPTMKIDLPCLLWAAQECKRQESGELSVFHLANAHGVLAQSWGRIHTWSSFIEFLGRIVDPEKNENGFRKQPVTIRGNAIPVRDFSRLIDQICALAYNGEMTAAEFYQEFEELHPFNDGNGRLGSLLYNAFHGTLQIPEVPPEFKVKA